MEFTIDDRAPNGRVVPGRRPLVTLHSSLVTRHSTRYLGSSAFLVQHTALVKALLYSGPFDLAYTDWPDPAPGPDDVVVRVRAVGICGSDVHGHTGETGRRLPPLVMGHEAAGVVEAVGADVTGVRPGDRVCFDSTVFCNRCDACRAGLTHRCANREVLGVSVPGMKRHGAMAEFVVLPSWTIVKMPEALSFTQAALLEPVSIAVHAVDRGAVEPGASVLVVGTGTIGLFVVQAARLAGADRIIAADLDERRLALADRLGADVTINPAETDLQEAVDAATGGRGVDVAFEVVGFAGTLQAAIAAVGRGGRVVLVGNLTSEVAIPVQEVISNEVSLVGTYASGGTYGRCVDLVAGGRIDVLPLVSETLPLADGAAAFARLHAGDEDLLKVVLEP